MKPIRVEPARYAMSGLGIFPDMRHDYYDDAESFCSLDAPEYMPRGSCVAAHITVDGAIWVSTSEPFWPRIGL